MQPRIAVTVSFENEPILQARIESELRAKGIRVTAGEYRAQQAMPPLNDQMPLFAFEWGPRPADVGSLTMVLKPMDVRTWPTGEVGLMLWFQASSGTRTLAWPTPIKILDAKLDEEKRVTDEPFLRGNLENFLARWPASLKKAISRIPIPIQARVGPKGALTEIEYDSLSADFSNDQAVFLVQLDRDGRVDRFRACNRDVIAGPFVDSDNESGCESILAKGGRRKPTGPGTPAQWKWDHIFLERFWRIPPK